MRPVIAIPLILAASFAAQSFAAAQESTPAGAPQTTTQPSKPEQSKPEQSSAAATPSQPSSEAAKMAPNELVRKMVLTEQKAGNEDHSQWMYQSVITIPQPAKTETIVETKNCDVSYVDEINGKPLAGEQKSAEDQRVERFVHDPEEQKKARRASDADTKQSAKLFAMLPEAFLYQEAGTDGDNVKLMFKPNPQYTSHSAEAFVFHKMDGFIVVNTKEDRLVEISGHLSHGVEFAGGLFGHLDPGGTFDVLRQEVGPGHWEITKIKVNMNGRALFFKTISVHQDEVHRHFEPVPDTTTVEQAEMLAEKKSATPPATGN